jgi:hypothetical protein
MRDVNPSPSGPVARPRPTGPTGPAEPSIASVQAHNEKVAQRLIDHQRYEADRLQAMRSLKESLDAPYVPELPRVSSLGARSGPLADLRVVSGSQNIPSGTRASLHDFTIPFRGLDETSALRLPETMAEPFINSGLMRNRAIKPWEIDDIAKAFNTVPGVNRGGGWNPRTASSSEIRSAQEAARDLAPEYSGRFVEVDPSIQARPRYEGRGQEFPYSAQQSSWDARLSSPINSILRKQMIEDVASQVGRNPFMHESVDVRALQGLLENINSGTVSSAMYPEGLEYLFREGIAPNATRVNRSGAGSDSYRSLSGDRKNLRAATEFGNFGVPIGAGPELRPHYGFIQAAENANPFRGKNILDYGAARSYGPIVAEWSDAVRPQTSFSVGDSLNAMTSRGMTPTVIPRPLSNPTIQDVAFAGGYDFPNTSYVETQMFGGPRLENLNSLRVAQNYSDEISKLLAKYGINIPVKEMGQTWTQPRR